MSFLNLAPPEEFQARIELFLQLILTVWTLDAVPNEGAERAASFILDETANLDEEVG
jgi:hypothetical protein